MRITEVRLPPIKTWQKCLTTEPIPYVFVCVWRGCRWERDTEGSSSLDITEYLKQRERSHFRKDSVTFAWPVPITSFLECTHNFI